MFFRLSVAFSCVALSLGACAQPLYKIVPLNGLTGANITTPFGVNDQGIAVGSCWKGPVQTAVLWATSSPTVLPGFLGSNQDTAYAVNTAGTVVGASNQFACSWVGGAVSLLALGGFGPISQALTITDDGLIGGWANNAADTNNYAMVWVNGIPTSLTPPTPYSKTSVVTAFGPAHQPVGFGQYPVVGTASRGVTWSGQSYTLLPIFSDILTFEASSVLGVNSKGTMVGSCGSNTGPFRPCFWSAGQIFELPILNTFVNGYVRGVDDNGRMYGYCTNIQGQYAAAAWLNGQVRDFKDLTDSTGNGWVFNIAYAVSPHGYLVGSGSQNGVQKGFLALPLKKFTLVGRGSLVGP